MVQGIQKIQRLPIPEDEPLSTIKMAKVKFFEMCTGIGNYCFPSNFETKQDNAKIPSDFNSRKSDTSLVQFDRRFPRSH